MRYRRLSPDGDYTFGQGQANFLINSPECVGQSVSTRLKLFTNEWFLDKGEGTPWAEEVLDKYTQTTRDTAIRQRILATKGVTAINNYQSESLPNRLLIVSCDIDTQFGQTTVQVTL